MFRPRPRSGHPHLFSSAKSAAPVPARHPALREALVHASLDPAVRAISHVATAHVGSPQVEVDLDAIILTRDDARLHLDVVPARRVRDLDAEGLVQIALRELGLQQLVVTAGDLRAEPRRSNARLAWSYKDRPVAVPLRLSILKVLADEGPMPLGTLLETLRSSLDPSPAVMALACADLLEIDLTSGPLGPSTQVRSRT
ncbi:hypothetical protein I6F30_11270 [Bradyrhizobium sp. NBAIM20]|uniref:hypothetical protein n=1 Tax=unclassified Bradyrhizobium TaxID=2631580 RepID=UPI001CD29EBC|nr:MULTISPECIES: hypothetical protein [unclassified Bradyrhizobium]MCA1411716.1 hypothetical protein [Bradyrhizobium sp. NBAIM20]MCA1460949.1 hypothetical protein [Bradyrhizobium sp. NBAIM18]